MYHLTLITNWSIQRNIFESFTENIWSCILEKRYLLAEIYKSTDTVIFIFQLRIRIKLDKSTDILTNIQITSISIFSIFVSSLASSPGFSPILNCWNGATCLSHVYTLLYYLTFDIHVFSRLIAYDLPKVLIEVQVVMVLKLCMRLKDTELCQMFFDKCCVK